MDFLKAPGTLLHMLFLIFVSVLALVAFHYVPQDRTDVLFMGVGLIVIELFISIRFARHERWEEANAERLTARTDKALASALALGNTLTERFIATMEAHDSAWGGMVESVRKVGDRITVVEERVSDAHGRVDAVDRRLVHVEDHLRIRRDIRPVSQPEDGG